MFLDKTADKIVFKFLNNINYGYLELTTVDGKILKFGNSDQKLRANIVIKKKNHYQDRNAWQYFLYYGFLYF